VSRSFLTHLECGACGAEHDAARLHNVCAHCGKPLLARYDLAAAGRSLTRESLRSRRTDLWRYSEVLPVADDANVVSLGEGSTPLVRAERLAGEIGCGELYIKDEAGNPTQSFKARGMAVAVSRAKELGVTRLAAPSAGNAGGALAAYATRAGLEAYLFMPRDTPRANVVEATFTGAHVRLVDGLITDCGAEVARGKESAGWFDVSTLKEPYRVEGKKTLGYELAEQLGWTLPDVIVYPTGGGTGLIGMWKAFAEMEALGWIGSGRPKMVTVQADGCAPIVTAFENGARFADEFPNAATIASGLRVPKAIGDFLILDALRASGGTAVAVSDADLIQGARDIARFEGIFACPEGGACVPAVRRLVADGTIGPADRVVIFNTAAGVKYLDTYTQ
jgi:threonine synthase